MRWSLHLPSPGLVAGTQPLSIGDVERAEAAWTLRLGPDPEGRSARVALAAAERALHVTLLAEDPSKGEPGPAHDEWYYRAHVVLFLNPGHDHATRWMFAVDDAGGLVHTADWALPGEEPGDTCLVKLDPAPFCSKIESRFRRLSGTRFAVQLRLPAESLWGEDAAPLGLALKVGFHGACLPVALCWPEAATWTRDTPLLFGDLYRQPPPLRIEQLEIHEPAWSPAQNELLLTGARAEDAPESGRARVEAVLPGGGETAALERPWQAEGGRFSLRLPLRFPSRAKWANDARKIARLRLTLADEERRTLWQAEYPFGFDAGIIVRERFGPQGAPPAKRPAPSDPDFRDQYRRYILTRLPDYRVRGMEKGAPSNFYLEDPESRASLDLAAPDALASAAAMLAERFPDWPDALCAAAMWVYHPLITRHSSTWSRVSGSASLATIPRLGGCFCGDTARLTACLAERIGQRLGVPLRAFSMGLRGHLATLVETPLGRVCLDGMLGLWFHTLDHTRLATLEEMRAERAVVESAWYWPRAHGHEFFFENDKQIIRPWRRGALIWPPGLD